MAWSVREDLKLSHHSNRIDWHNEVKLARGMWDLERLLKQCGAGSESKQHGSRFLLFSI
jgi:hypothetical protein